ncbi:hypothetical protein F5050DRAFT_1820286 [Lentinula boryana]|uniref:U3 small nucleolar RNA-associated protein 20 domain-containing protein n=1 Tax=Lentinula boryana TaxID=40481 RepID=A0ABQ8QRQ9_9AGAR|nr:hypothetical protein F5050DRAFT_1820286 [Lentinula boryana]
MKQPALEAACHLDPSSEVSLVMVIQRNLDLAAALPRSENQCSDESRTEQNTYHLVHVTKEEGSGNGSVPDIAFVSSEMIFGESGKDDLAEGFKTKLREVKTSSSKGLDWFHITAGSVSVYRINVLLLPLRDIMHETESLKVLMQSVDEVLKHNASGLNTNTHIAPSEALSGVIPLPYAHHSEFPFSPTSGSPEETSHKG